MIFVLSTVSISMCSWISFEAYLDDPSVTGKPRIQLQLGMKSSKRTRYETFKIGESFIQKIACNYFSNRFWILRGSYHLICPNIISKWHQMTMICGSSTKSTPTSKWLGRRVYGEVVRINPTSRADYWQRCKSWISIDEGWAVDEGLSAQQLWCDYPTHRIHV